MTFICIKCQKAIATFLNLHLVIKNSNMNDDDPFHVYINILRINAYPKHSTGSLKCQSFNDTIKITICSTHIYTRCIFSGYLISKNILPTRKYMENEFSSNKEVTGKINLICARI